MAFEVWDASQDITQSNKPWIRLSKNTIVLSKNLKSELDAKGTKIQLAYDKKLKTIKINSVGENEKGLMLEKTKIVAGGFFKKFDINVEETKRYEAIWSDKEQGFLFKLD